MNDTRLKKENIKNLIIKVQNGDFTALEELIKLVQSDIYTSFSHLTCKNDDISDLTQETLLKMAKGLSQLKDINNFKAWLNKIVVNTFYDYLKKQPQNLLIYSDEQINKIKDKINSEPSRKYYCSEMEHLIRVAILSLPDELRLTIILREFEGLSYADISKATNTNTGTVKSRLARARLKLQKQLQEYL